MSYSFEAPRRRPLCGATLAVVLLPLALLLSACETPPPVKDAPIAIPVTPRTPAPPPVDAAQLNREAALRDMVALQDRLYRVAAPILVSNPALCRSNTRNQLGFMAKNKYSYSSEYANSAQKVLGLNEQLQVTSVMTGSGAASAGVQSGDKLVAVNDIPLPQGPNAEHQAHLILAPAIGEHMSINLTLNRGGADMALKVPLTRACAFLVVLGNTEQVAAYADGVQVMVTRGMLSATKSDDELAFVLATEMAHNVLGHVKKQRTGASVAAKIDNLARIHPDNDEHTQLKASTSEFDIAADKLGLYMAARAGFAVEGAGAFWSRLASANPPSVADSYTVLHPVTSSRLTAIAKVTNEIKGKQAGRKPLTP